MGGQVNWSTIPASPQLSCRATLSGHSSPVCAAAFSPDGTTVVTGSYDFTAKLWDAASGACRATLSGHSNCVCAAAFSPDGKTVVTGSSSTAKLWDAASGACRATLSGHSVTYLSFTSWTTSRTTSLWRLATSASV